MQNRSLFSSGSSSYSQFLPHNTEPKHQQNEAPFSILRAIGPTQGRLSNPLEVKTALATLPLECSPSTPSCSFGPLDEMVNVAAKGTTAPVAGKSCPHCAALENEDAQYTRERQEEHSWPYHSIFFGFGALFLVLGLLILSQTGNHACGLYFSHCETVKNSVHLLCFLLSASAFILGYKNLSSRS